MIPVIGNSNTDRTFEKEIDPQIAEIGERLERIERLLEQRLQPTDEGTDDSHIADEASG